MEQTVPFTPLDSATVQTSTPPGLTHLDEINNQTKRHDENELDNADIECVNESVHHLQELQLVLKQLGK